MLLTDSGLELKAFDTALASLIGNDPAEAGAKLLVEASKHQHKRVEIWDWFYLLLRAPMKTAVRIEFIDTPGMIAERFIGDVEAAFDLSKDHKGPPPSDLLPTTVSPDVLKMLERAEALAGGRPIGEVAVTLAILECAGDDMTEFFTDVMDRDKDGLGKFKKKLSKLALPPPPPSAPDQGLFELVPPFKLRQAGFIPDGWKFCKRWREDMAAMGIKMGEKPTVTTRHLLYSILGNSSGSLAAALSNSGIEVKNLHAALTRELSKPGRKRSDDFALTKGSLFGSVVTVLTEAGQLAQEREAKGIGEIDVHRAFLAKQQHEVQRLLPKEGEVNLSAIADYMAEAQVDEEDPSPLQRFTVDQMREKINDTICGQTQAVEKIVPYIRKLRFGRRNKNRPAGVFLFLGPTGTGKTQLGKELARYVYGNPEEMLFFEMGQFKGEESMTIFVGAPPGYKGYGEGQLTNGLRDHPECVVLFDEIEKADVKVFDALLRFTDEGVISDPSGPMRDGRRCIIVLTSNAGQDWLRSHIAEHPEAREQPEIIGEQLYDAAMKDLKKNGFRPEALGRVDKRIVFYPFSMETCRKIIDRVLKSELTQFTEDNSVEVVVPDEVRSFLAKIVFDSAMDEGARAAPRAVTEYVVSPVIEMLVPYQERGESYPSTVKAVMLGKDGQRADGTSSIHWEIEG